MRIANKYDMEDIKTAIIQLISNLSAPEIGEAIERLAFMAGFPTSFSVRLAGDAFLQTCSISTVPSANDLKPLMAHPAIVAAMIKNRENMLRSQLVSELRPRVPEWLSPGMTPPAAPTPVPRVEGWLIKELTSFGFSE